MGAKYQVFVSSTYEDLVEERDQVIRAILEMGHIPVGMEMFSAADDEQWQIIARQIDDADYYVVIVAHRYGSTDPSGLSYTEKEYDYAVVKGIPALGFLMDEKASWPANNVESDQAKRASLEQFKAKVRGRMVNFWSTKSDLHAKVSIALMKSFTANPRVGWIRASEVAGPAVTNELTRLSAENADLRAKLASLNLRTQQAEGEHAREVARILLNNKVTAHVRKKSDDWGEAIETNLFSVFKAIAPKLLVENSCDEIACDLALGLTGQVDYYHSWPVPENYIAAWIADLHVMEVIEPSKRKHPIGDRKEYWTLTETGRRLLRDFRRFLLEQAHDRETANPEAPEAPEDPKSPSDSAPVEPSQRIGLPNDG